MNLKTEYNERPWDTENQFYAGTLFRTEFWTVEVSYKQHTPGSFIIFLNRFVSRFKDLFPNEVQELPEVIGVVETILAKHPQLQPELCNYLQLGNKVPHFHIHGIPRYSKPVHFIHKEWIDPTFGSPPVWSQSNISHQEVSYIRAELLKYM